MTTGADDTTANELDALASLLIEHANSSYPDVVALLARAHGGYDRDVPVTAKLTAISSTTATAVVSSPDGERPLVVEIDPPITTAAEARQWLIDLAAAARKALGITEPTSVEQEDQALRALRTHITRVVSVAEVTPRFRRITFGGGDLDTYEPGGLDSFLYVLLPPAGRRELTIDASFSWDAYEEMDPAERPVGAYYTVRAWRPATADRPAELDMLFLLHDEGAATTWAAHAEPGDPAALWGPRTAYAPPDDTDWLLLAGDETGLPAMAVILEHKPAGLPAEVFVEVDGPECELELPDDPDIAVHWIRREGAAGTTTALADAVRALALRPGNVYAWGGGESRSVTAIRKYLRRERGIDQHRVTMVGYWRHASTPLDDDEE